MIAGFNTMSEEEKEKYDTVALCKFMGKTMFALSFSMFVGYLVKHMKSNGFLPLVLFYLLVLSRSSLYMLIQEIDLRNRMSNH